jgi:hypothetical protein
VNVGSDIQLEFPALEVPGGPIDRIQQPRGNAFYDVGKRGSRKLRVETPFLVAVVKGTQFNVAAREDATTIALFEGQLEIRSADETDVVDIVAGEIASRHRSEQDIGVIKMDESRSGPAPAVPPGAEGGEHAAPAPRAEPVEEGDAYLAHDDSAANDAMDFELADARIDLGATDNLTASLVDPALAGVGSGADSDDAGLGVSAGPGPVIDAGSNAPPAPTGEIPPAAEPGSAIVDVGTGGGAPADAGLPVDAGAAVDAGNGSVNVDVGVGTEVPVVDTDVGGDVDLGVDLNGDDNSNSGPGNGNANGHDKDNGNGEANGHDKDDDGGIIEQLVEDVVNLLDNALRKPGNRK